MKQSKQDWISKKIKKLMDEGKPQKQAIAIAYSMYREKNKVKKSFIDYFIESSK